MGYSGPVGGQPDGVTITTAVGGALKVVDSISRGVVPVGAIIAWHKSFTNTPALPSGFVECNGQVLNDAESVYNTQTIPDLNSGTQRFIRGASTSGTTGGADTVTLAIGNMPAHTHTLTSVNNNSSAGTTGHVVEAGAANNDTVTTSSQGSGTAFSILPSYIQMVWIMRVK